MDVAILLHPFAVALEAITSLTAVQFVLVDAFLVAMTTGTGLSFYQIGRRATQRDILAAATVVAVEHNPNSPHLGTYKELGEGFLNDPRGTSELTPTSYVTTLAGARARGVQPRKDATPRPVPEP